ncbi:phosphatase [Desulforamulus ruminis]|uniref:PHP domain protein n=1 Tax=Desulforamulus ruminis (strain ATCC 23193 / DSM 2154 / NCIMB 8452 / DL) TaxID=696281 RepID=F6DUY2_DESRL|nr:phosphatase [Desulforamulus ruminis]AEG61379.1 PHP domain protein [Desulforamulus ruminis DSM 2154]
MLLEADLHTHTLASGHAFSTFKEMVDQAALVGLKMLAITDHGINMPGGPHAYYFSQILGLPQEINGIQILRGVEANIIDVNGSLDMPERLLKTLDFVIAGFHAETGYAIGSVEQNTRAILGAIQNPYVHLIAHPCNPEYPIDIERVVQAARSAGKALELNNSSLFFSRPGSGPRCSQMARLAAKTGTLLTINSDAHSCYAVGKVEQAVEVALQSGVKPAQVLNTSVRSVRDYLQSHRQRLKRIS